MIAAPPYAMRVGGAWLHNADPNLNSAGISGSTLVREKLSEVEVGGAIRHADPQSLGRTSVKRSFAHTTVGPGLSCGTPDSHPVNLPHPSFCAQQFGRFPPVIAPRLQHGESATAADNPPSHKTSNITAAHPIGPLIFIGRTAFIPSEIRIRPPPPRRFTKIVRPAPVLANMPDTIPL
jgi:hypothetical protein